MYRFILANVKQTAAGFIKLANKTCVDYLRQSVQLDIMIFITTSLCQKQLHAEKQKLICF